MKKILLFGVLALLVFSLFPQQNVSDKPLNISFYYAPFYLPGTDSLFVEFYFSIDGNSAKYLKTKYLDKKGNEKTGYASAINFKILITKNDTVKGIKKYVLSSPIKVDSEAISPDFADVKRFKLIPDKYKLSI
jgi:hypothetical protein